MKVIGKLGIGLATVLGGSYLGHLLFNQREWFNLAVTNYVQVPMKEELEGLVPTGTQLLGFFVTQFPKQILMLSQSDHFLIRNISQKILSSAILPEGFNIAAELDEVSDSVLTSLARESILEESCFPGIKNCDLPQKNDKELSEAFRQLLSSLPTSGQCAAWFTESAFHGGKSGHNLYKTIFWHPEDGDHLETVSADDEILLFLKALRKHSEVREHRSVILEAGGLELLRLVSLNYGGVKVERLVSHVLGNMAIDASSRDKIIKTGWLRELRRWIKSKDLIVKSQSLRALANLDREGEKEQIYDDGIFVAYPVERLKWCRPEIDIVFVHGLRGSPFRTWRSETDDSLVQTPRNKTGCWPRDWFPVDIPRCRVVLVEYDTELSGWTSKCPSQPEVSTIEYRSSELLNKLKNAGIGRRPVVWFAHSMGGLMVKQILVDATKSSEFSSLQSNTKGVVFYAVPHKGSEIASMVAGKARYLFLPSSEVKALQKGSEYLEVLQKNFLDLVQNNKVEVLSFAETEPAKIVRDTLIVSPDSADFGVGEFIQLPANHYNVCKPRSRCDPTYVKTVDFVKRHLVDNENFMPIILF
ncbi:protein SERAC1-like [Dendronephthya gigantea]|uniref:protein SERAC1-like n=1 Tax=Dendronephthya gigantea TaxID=151771 RepID=UPI00106CF718|nr:protein SERAC1-like [Dendronephthya gigantea]XP_028415091.1 protein SERAC1-like [Dendronephthya gigantea]